MQHDFRNSQAVHGNSRTSILKELACAGRHSIKHDKRGLVRKFQQLGRRSDGTKVEDTRGSVKNLGRYAASWIVWWPNRPSSTAALA